MSMARVVITAVVLERRPVSQVARDYGVSRQWVHRLVTRYRLEGETAFEPRSRRPGSNPRRVVTAEVEERIVGLRKQLTDQGLDAGAETIAWHLRQANGTCPSVATIWRTLSRRGFVAPQPHKRPRSSWHRFEADLPNELWQADITHWPLTDGTDAEILDVIDDHSRLLVASTARTIFKAGDVVTDLTEAMNRLGRPERMLTDNGAVFTGNYRGHGWVALERELVAQGISLSHSKPYHPQTCGKIERAHQTIKKWLAAQDPQPATTEQLQALLDEFRAYYNQQRPHRAVGRRTPDAAWHARPRALPTRQGPIISEHFRVRKDRVDSNGKLTLRHGSRLHHIGVGRTWAGTRVLMLIRDLQIRIITEHDGELIRELELDPTRGPARWKLCPETGVNDVSRHHRVVQTGLPAHLFERLTALAAELPVLLARPVRPTPVLSGQIQRRLTQSQVEQLVAEYLAGKDMNQLARDWQVHRTTIANHLRVAGIPLRRQGLTDPQLQEATELYIQDHWSCQRLAEHYACDDETIRQSLKKAGVRMRKPWER